MKKMILVVDDEPKILETTAAYLERSGFTPLCAKDGREAQRLLTENPVDLVVLDLMLPVVPGEEICKRIRSGFYDEIPAGIPVIMLTAKADEISIVRGLNMGADDYITKPFSPRELIARIQAILRRSPAHQSPCAPSETAGPLLQIKDIVIDRENRRIARKDEIINLTGYEYKIFELLAGRSEKIFSRDEILEEITGGVPESFDRSIDSHIKNLRQKLGDDPRSPKYIETVYGMGYRIAV